MSARSSSPPNSVEAFADPRRRERANTLDSHAPPGLGSHACSVPSLVVRSNGARLSAMPVLSGLSLGICHLDSAEEACVHPFDEPGRIPVIDYEELEEFVALNQKAKTLRQPSQAQLEFAEQNPRIFYDLRPGARSLRRSTRLRSPDPTPILPIAR